MSKKHRTGSLMAASAAVLSAYMTFVVYLVTSMHHSIDGVPASGPMNGWGLTVGGTLASVGLGWLAVCLVRNGRGCPAPRTSPETTA